jgi:hypothetical protein
MTYQPYDPIPPAQQYPAYDPAQPSGPPVSSGPYYAPVSGPGGLPVPYAQPLYQTPIVVTVTAPPASGAATASLVLGLIGILVGYCLFGIPCVLAVIFGHIGLVQTRGGEKSGRGMAVAGLVLGYICVIPMIIFTVLFIGLIFGSAASSGY